MTEPADIPPDTSDEDTAKALPPAGWVTGLVVVIAGLLALFALT